MNVLWRGKEASDSDIKPEVWALEQLCFTWEGDRGKQFSLDINTDRTDENQDEACEVSVWLGASTEEPNNPVIRQCVAASE